MNRFTIIGATVAGSLATVIMLALPVSAATKTYHAGSCRASGDFATCVTSGTAKLPVSIRVHVSASRKQQVLVSWDMVCSKGLGAGAKSGQFTAVTPVNRLMHHPYAHPDSCIVSADAQLSSGGSLHVWVTYRR
jgi:hypothetical protein